MDTKSATASNPTVDSGPRDTTSHPESGHQPEEPPEEPRMIGDFDGSASEFWKLFRDEAKSHDDARINTPKRAWTVPLYSSVHILSVPLPTWLC